MSYNVQHVHMVTTLIIFLINNMSNMPIHMYFAIQLPINNKCKILLLYPKVLDICIMQLVCTSCFTTDILLLNNTKQ